MKWHGLRMLKHIFTLLLLCHEFKSDILRCRCKFVRTTQIRRIVAIIDACRLVVVKLRGACLALEQIVMVEDISVTLPATV